MKTSKQGLHLIHSFEGCKLKAYLCPAKVWTIGFGNTFYEDGEPVKRGDVITQERAEALFLNVLREFERAVKELVKKPLTPNQFSALVSFAYNCGVANLKASTLLKRVNANPNDPDIKLQFNRWNKAGGRILLGLKRRREAEANLYFS